MNPDYAHIKAVVESQWFNNCKYIEHHLTHSDLLDEDGYPTDEALEIIERWDFSRKSELFALMKSLWHLSSWGWHEETDDEKTTYSISTAGWSGNESLIAALERNQMVTAFTWVQSRRGGHYIYEVKNDRC